MSLLVLFRGGGAPPAAPPIAAFEYDDETVTYMRKNVAGQHVEGQVNDRTTGAPLTSAVTVYVTGDNGTQTAGGGTTTHKGNGAWNYAPTQAETNFNHIAFTFVHATGVVKTYNVFTYSYDPHNTASLGLTNVDVAVSSRMATYTQPTGFLAATFPTGTVASTTNITAGTVTTASNVTTVNGLAANVITAASINAAALNGKGDWNIGKTGYSLTATTGLGNQTANITGNLSGSVGSVTGAVTVGTNNDKTGYSLTQAFPANFSALSISAGTGLVDLTQTAADKVWASNGPLGKTYGLMASEVNAAQIIRVSQFQAGSTTQALVLDTGASTTDDFYNRTTITIATGPAAGQNRLINDYDGATRTAHLDRPLLVSAPSSGNYFAIDSRGNTRAASDLRVGLAQGGAVGSITLQSTESALDDFYNRMFVLIESGTGEGQARLIDDYVGATRVATVGRNWIVAPDNTSRYVILPFGSVKVSQIDTDVIDAASLAADAVAEIQAGLATAANQTAIKAKTDQLTFTKANELDANIQSINDATIVGNGSGTPFNV